MPNRVFTAVTDHLALENSLGGYEAENEMRSTLDGFYSSFAKLLNADSSEIAYVENATRAWDMAFYSIPLQEGDEIITHDSEYVSNYLAFLQIVKRRGVKIVRAPSDGYGQIDVDGLRRCITSKSRLIAITHVPTQGGLVNPAEEVGRVANDAGLIYLLDACQSVGQLDVDVAKIGCHILSGTGRKYLRGPRGTGFLYISNSIIDRLDPPFIDLHAASWITDGAFEYSPAAKRFENYESYVAGRIGLKTAVDYALDIGLSSIEKRVTQLAQDLRDQLVAISGITVHDLGERKCGIVTFMSDAETAEALCARLSAGSANVSVSLPAYARLDFGGRQLPAIVRASVHYYNTKDEIDRFCKIVAVDL